MSEKKVIAYIGCYTRESIAGIHICDVDMESGQLTKREQVKLDNPSHICIAHNGKALYTTTDLGVAYLQIREDGSLEHKETKWTGGIRGCYIFISDDDRWLFVGGYYDGRITVMSLNEDGSLGEVTEGIFHKGVGSNVTRRTNRPHVNCVRLSPDQKYLFAVDNGLDCIKVYEFDHVLGKLRLVDMVHLSIESAPRHMLFSRNGKFFYMICELDNKVYAYSYDGSGKVPVIERIQKIAPAIKPDRESAGSDLAMSFDGKYLVCSHAGINEASVFAIDQETGLLEFKFINALNGEYPKTVKIFPDGRHFLSLNNESGTVSAYEFDEEHTKFLSCAKDLKIISPSSVVFHEL